MSTDRFMELLSLVTYAKLIQRDMFQRRIAQDAEIYMHEMLYPILQGIAVSDTPRDIFGKAMSLADNLITEFLEVYTLVPIEEISQIDAAMRAGELNPMEAKRTLGQALVERYYDKDTAIQESEWFTKVFSGRSIPEDVPTVSVVNANATLFEILRTCLPAESSSELRRLIQYGSVRLNGEEKLSNPDQRHAVTSGNVLRVGKRRWFRIFLGQS